METLKQLYNAFFSANNMLAPQYLIAWVLIAWAIYLWRRETVGFFGWLFPSALWRHKSTRTDLALFTMGSFLTFFGVISRFLAIPAIAASVAAIIPFSLFSGFKFSPVAIALVLFLASDFTTYWTHRAFHQLKAIWPLHAVHHSAAVLTPVTGYRQHPLSSLIITSIHTVVVGGIFGILIGVFDPNTPIATIVGANTFIVLANATVANFHHSHIWISFGPIVERFFVSPAQHQIHHSTKPAHFNKNYGSILAIWDWMFGTLYITDKDEKVIFGLDDPTEAPLMTQRLGTILWDPIRRIFNLSIRGSRS